MPERVSPERIQMGASGPAAGAAALPVKVVDFAAAAAARRR